MRRIRARREPSPAGDSCSTARGVGAADRCAPASATGADDYIVKPFSAAVAARARTCAAARTKPAHIANLASSRGGHRSSRSRENPSACVSLTRDARPWHLGPYRTFRLAGILLMQQPRPRLQPASSCSTGVWGPRTSYIRRAHGRRPCRGGACAKAINHAPRRWTRSATCAGGRLFVRRDPREDRYGRPP